MGKAEEKISQIAEKLAEELKVELVDVEFVKEGSQWFLRIFIAWRFHHRGLNGC